MLVEDAITTKSHGLILKRKHLLEITNSVRKEIESDKSLCIPVVFLAIERTRILSRTSKRDSWDWVIILIRLRSVEVVLAR